VRLTTQPPSSAEVKNRHGVTSSRILNYCISLHFPKLSITSLWLTTGHTQQCLLRCTPRVPRRRAHNMLMVWSLLWSKREKIKSRNTC